MEKKRKVVVVGAGAFGTAIANLFLDAGSEAVVWGRDPSIIQDINSRKENSKYLPGVSLHPDLAATTSLESALLRAEWIVSAIPTQQIRTVFKPHLELFEGKPILNVAKGIELGTHYRVSEIFGELCPKCPYAILSGPSFASELVRGLPTAVTLASVDRGFNLSLQSALATDTFRAYSTEDVLGVELAGALKNVVAIAAGIVDGLGLGYNAGAAVINRGLAEIARMGAAQGAKQVTFYGLAGMGDLVLTCTGPLSRNRRTGVLLGQGKMWLEIQKTLGGVAEGVYTAGAAYALASRFGVDMPILSEVRAILYESKPALSALSALMSRSLKEEAP